MYPGRSLHTYWWNSAHLLVKLCTLTGQITNLVNNRFQVWHPSGPSCPSLRRDTNTRITTNRVTYLKYKCHKLCYSLIHISTLWTRVTFRSSWMMPGKRRHTISDLEHTSHIKRTARHVGRDVQHYSINQSICESKEIQGWYGSCLAWYKFRIRRDSCVSGQAKVTFYHFCMHIKPAVGRLINDNPKAELSLTSCKKSPGVIIGYWQLGEPAPSASRHQRDFPRYFASFALPT